MKAKFYSFYSLLLFIGFSVTVHAQEITMYGENITAASDGSVALAGNRLWYVIEVTGPMTMINPNVYCPVPAGTRYIPGTTTLDGVSFLPNDTKFPFADPHLIRTPYSATDKVVITFEVEVTANTGNISCIAQLKTVNYGDFTSNEKLTILEPSASCYRFYTMTTSIPEGYNPRQPTRYFPYQYLRSVNASTGAETIIYNGTTGVRKNAYTDADLSTPVLTDATAMTYSNGDGYLYFVNKPVNNQPADLCRITTKGMTAIAYQFVGTPLTTNTTSPITRMASTADGKMYALTDNGQDFIEFSISGFGTGSVVNKANHLLINDPANNTHDVFAETGGDMVPDGSGNLLLIPNTGNVYRINPISYVATYLGTIPGFPAAGCNSALIDKAGDIYIGGFYQNVYKLKLSTWTLTTLWTGNYASVDFAGCSVPLQPARVATNGNSIRNEAGTIQISDEVSAKVLPNPFRDQLNIQMKLNTAAQVKVRLIDLYGRTVYTTTEKLNAGASSVRVPVPAGLASGVYVVELWTGDKRLLQKKLIKE